MRIEIITMWYNEEFLAPFFLKHYAWADKITLFHDRDSDDRSLDIARKAANVEIKPFRFPDMLDEGLKQLRLNEAYRNSACDWVAIVDADEFLFHKEHGEFRYDLHALLETSDADVYQVPFFQPHRHKDDADLDNNLPAVPQRRHGTFEANGIFQSKPCVARAGQDICWKVGCHAVSSGSKQLNIIPDVIFCSHWNMADPCFVIERRLKNRKHRQSRNNIERNMDSHNHAITIQKLQAEFALHADDPLLI